MKVDDLEGFEAVVHLVALNNDSLGNLAPQLTSSSPGPLERCVRSPAEVLA